MSGQKLAAHIVFSEMVISRNAGQSCKLVEINFVELKNANAMELDYSAAQVCLEAKAGLVMAAGRAGTSARCAITCYCCKPSSGLLLGWKLCREQSLWVFMC